MDNLWWLNWGVEGFQYSFNGSSSTTDGITTFAADISAFPSTNGIEIHAVVTNQYGSATSSVVTLTALWPPAIFGQPNNVITNPGNSIVFQASVAGSEPMTYQWLFNGLNLNTTNPTNTLVLNDVTTNHAGKYRLIASNPVGSATSQVATLTISGYPAILSEPKNTDVVHGHSTQLSVLADGLAPLAYQWWFGTNHLTNATNATLTIANAQTNDAGSYFVVITNHLGTVTSQPATLTVLTPPTILTHPQSLATLPNTMVTFTTTATGSFPMNPSWWYKAGTNILSVFGYFNNTVSNDIATYSIRINNHYDVQGDYFAVVTNAYGRATSSLATLTILVPPAITAQPVSVTTNLGASVTFSVGVSGTPPFGYQWLFYGTNLAGASSINTLRLENISPNDIGGYQVIVTNAANSATSHVAYLTILNPSLTPAQLFALNNPGADGFFLGIAFEAGKNYRIQTTTNMQYWTDLTNFVSSSVTMEFLDTSATNDTQRFYRVVSP